MDGPSVFIIMLMVLGFFMALGKVAVFKHIPVYYRIRSAQLAARWARSACSAASCCHWLLA